MADNSSQDVFKRIPIEQRAPLTADTCNITWGDPSTGNVFLSTATNVRISYAQQVTRRRTLGNVGGSSVAVLYTSQPQGSIAISRLIAEGGANDLFSRPGWNACETNVDITIEFAPGTDNLGAPPHCKNVDSTIYTAKGCIVSQYELTAEAEGLSVVDNIVIEFLQLQATPKISSTS